MPYLHPRSIGRRLSNIRLYVTVSEMKSAIPFLLIVTRNETHRRIILGGTAIRCSRKSSATTNGKSR